MRHELELLPDPEAVARRGAAIVAAAARAAVERGGRCSLALSGGTTPRAMLARLRDDAVPWERVDVYQVDERVAPAGSEERNLTRLAACLGGLPARVLSLPVEDADLEAAAVRYAAALPARFDLVHLGLGDDGHTASLVPGDPVLDVTDRAVAITAPYRGTRRMTLTYPALARAELLLWLVTGAAKAGALARLLACDPSIPAGRVEAARSLVVADRAAGRARARG
ncbi:MAG: 6-phosphogluconolactonase [Thermoleophilia bacterium]|nr:6-phosphogluconolactonase [Thermoleophilia bacterium]